MSDKRHQSADDRRTRKHPKKRQCESARILVPAPEPLAERWADRYPREISIPDAARICHRSLSTARAWAAGKPIERLCLATLQAHLWGHVLPPAMTRRGIHVHNDALVTRNGYPLSAPELDALAWAFHQHAETVRDLLGPPVPPPPKPKRRWRPAGTGWNRRNAAP